MRNSYPDVVITTEKLELFFDSEDSDTTCVHKVELHCCLQTACCSIRVIA